MNSSFILWQAHPSTPDISTEFVRDLNFYAAHHLSPYPGRFRGDGNDYDVMITGTEHLPPKHHEVQTLMGDFIERLKYLNKSEAPSLAAAYALWRLNWIHPFAEGNGRTSRATSYFVLCQRYGKWFPGTPVLELIRRNRDEYCQLLAAADKTVDTTGMADLIPIQQFLERLLVEQLESVAGR
ncbi:Fic family protein [Salipiger aestuarii]|uniref:Fic family protein n=1 Tax=Salipiger aestuarii TaxID=568098 RepID=UPI001681751B|nr:Fic family protein [Salipiger aestuarii]